MIKDNQTLVLGGLIDDTVRTTDERVPLLGDIPVLGRLFRYQRTTKVKQNLMVFMHPRILRDERLANHYTGEKYNYMRSQQLERRRKDEVLMIDELPTLPELSITHGASVAPNAESRDERTERDNGSDGGGR
jgi:general secretion pathway protein D